MTTNPPAELVPLLREIEVLQDDASAEHDVAKLRRQVWLCRQVLTSVSPAKHGPLWAYMQGTLGSALKSLGELSGDAEVLRAAIAGHNAALTVYTRDAMPVQWAATQANRANALWHLGDLSGDAKVLRAAVAGYDTAQSIYTRKAMPAEWAAIQNDRAAVLRNLSNLSGDPEVLRAAVAGYDAALSVLTRPSMPAEWASTQTNRAGALASLGDLSGDVDVLHAAMAGYDAAQTIYTRKAMPAEWATAQVNRAIVLVRLGELSGDPEMLRAAVEACDAALPVFPRDARPTLWATAQTNRANALQSLGTRLGDPDVLRAAVTTYDEALTIIPRDAMSAQWAATHSNRANALQSLGALLGDPEALRAAVASYDAALIICVREGSPPEWATMQNNRANALLCLNTLSANPEVLRAAVAGYVAALTVRTREAMPTDWADTQNNRAGALTRLGQLSDDPEVLRAAVAGYDAALTVRTRTAMPVQWAATQNNRAGALMRLGQLVGDAEALRTAIDIWDTAQIAYPCETMPTDWATMQTNRAYALSLLGELLGDPEVLRAAVIGHDAALTIRTREAMPVDWAATQTNRANALQSLGELAADPEALHAAVAGYDAVLTIYTREAMPTLWATAQINRATALSRLGELSDDRQILRAAVEGCNATLTVHTREAIPAQWATTQNNRAGALARLGDLSGDPEALRAAVVGYDAALTVRTREAMPALWAATQHNRANVLSSLADLGDRPASVQALAAYRVALSEMAGSGAEDSHQATAAALARLLVRQATEATGPDAAAAYHEAAAVIDAALARSDAALLDARRSKDGREHSVGRAEPLYALRALCLARLGDAGAALAAAEAGRQRFAVEMLSLSLNRAAALNNPDDRASVEAAEERRAALIWQLGHDGNPAGAGLPRGWPSPERQKDLQTDLDIATEEVLRLHRRFGLIPQIDPLTADRIIAAAPKDGALVLPVVAAGQAVAFVVAGGMVEVVELRSLDPDVPNLDARVLRRRVISNDDSWLRRYGAMRKAIQERRFARGSNAYRDWSAHVTETLDWLWTVLLGPLDAHLRNRDNIAAGGSVVLLPTGLLGVLPLQAARPGDGAVPFGDRWTVSLAPSVRTLLDCRERAEAALDRPQRLFGIIDPDGSLPGARLEARALARLFSHAERKMLTGAEAARGQVLRWLSWPTHLHASTHGFHHPRTPAESGLLLAGDEKLLLRDLRAARLKGARLVFLSACETGLAGVLKLAEEFFGLPAGFAAAGAAGVVGSLWPVFDDTSYLLTTQFYSELHDVHGRERQPSAAALQAAQSWLRTVTYGDLQRDYEVETVGTDRFLLIGQRRSTSTPAASGRAAPGLLQRLFRGTRSGGGVGHPVAVAEDDTPQPIRLRIGADHERPFASPHEWAAFTATGA